MYNCILSLTLPIDVVGCHRRAPAALLLNSSEQWRIAYLHF